VFTLKNYYSSISSNPFFLGSTISNKQPKTSYSHSFIFEVFFLKDLLLLFSWVFLDSINSYFVRISRHDSKYPLFRQTPLGLTVTTDSSYCLPWRRVPSVWKTIRAMMRRLADLNFCSAASDELLRMLSTSLASIGLIPALAASTTLLSWITICSPYLLMMPIAYMSWKQSATLFLPNSRSLLNPKWAIFKMYPDSSRAWST